MKVPELTSERLIYRPLSMRHFSKEYVEWLNDPEVYKYLETRGGYTIEKLQEFLEEVEEKKILFWGIHLKNTDKHIGNIKIDPINTKHDLGIYSILMGDKNEWGKGYAYEASQRIINYCFMEAPSLRKLSLGVVKENVGAIRLYEKLGFLHEGVFEKHHCYDGEYYDLVRMAIFNPEIKYDD